MLKNIRLVIITSAYAFIAGITLVACGTKGPLYIPEQRYPQKETPQEDAVQKSIPQDDDIQDNPEANTGPSSSPSQ